MKPQKPLSLVIQEAKNMTFAAINEIQDRTKLPAFLFEGIIADVLAQVRDQKNAELTQDIARMTQEAGKGKSEGE